MRRSYAAAAGVALAATAALAVATTRYVPTAPQERIHDTLAEGGPTRTFEPRIGAAARYAPHAPITRSVGDDRYRWEVAARLEAARDRLPPGSALHAASSGLALLYRGETDGALDLLRDAVYLDPRSADYWSDLAAAGLVRGRPTDLVGALDAAETALEMAPEHAAARFNRGLALASLGLNDDARGAFLAAGSVAAQDGWRAEATERASRLPSRAQPSFNTGDLLNADRAGRVRFARAALDRMRSLLENELVPALGAACLKPERDDCASLLVNIQDIALAAAEVSPDKSWPDLATQLTSLGVAGVRRRAAELVAFGHATRLFSLDRVMEAAPIFAQLASADGRALVPVFWNATYSTCVDAYLRSEHSRARACLARLAVNARSRDYHYLRGKAEWVMSQISLSEADFPRASQEFERAIDAMRDAADTNQAAAVESLRATLLDQLGAVDEAWRDRVNALSHARLDARRLHTTLTGAAQSSVLLGFPRAALAFQTAALSNAVAWGQPGAVVEARLSQALTLQRLGRADEARDALRHAREQFARIADERARVRIESELSVVEGEVLAEFSPRDAVVALRRADQALASMNFGLLRTRLERARGVAAERAGDLSSARAAYERGVANIRLERASLDSTARIQSRDLVWDMYDRLVSVTLELGGTAAAFAAIEAAREDPGLSLAGTTAPPQLERLPSLLPKNTALIYFAVREKELLRWTITSAGADLHRFAIDRARLEYLVRRMRRLLEGMATNDTLRAASAPLHELIPSLPHAMTLAFVPDGALHELPFAALMSPVDGSFLIERHPVAVSPSARTLLSASSAAQARFDALTRVLVIEGRTRAAAGQPALAALPTAQEEVRNVAKAYPHATVLAGDDATPDRVLSDAGDYDIVHFAGHAMADRISPDLSRLFLSPSAAHPSGWLLLRDLQRLSFGRTALVVLGACETGAGRVYRGEGALSLARPFLRQGASGVVHTLWKVADAPSTRLLTALHTSIRNGVQPVVALQHAQIALLEHPGPADRTTTWAAFQYTGGIR